MTFIKVGNMIINTQYIAAIKLESQTCFGERCVSILMPTPNSSALQVKAGFPNSYHYKWHDFTSREAMVLKDYFSSFNNVVDLLPQHQEQTTF